MKTYRLFMTILAIIVIACSFGVQGQFQEQNVTPSIAYSTAAPILAQPTPTAVPSVARPPITFYSSCYYNQWGQYVCYNYSYYNIGNYYPWNYLLNEYSASNNLLWGGCGYYPGYWGYPGYGGYSHYPGYWGYPRYAGYGYYPGYWGYPRYGGYGYYPGYL
jgi:hypothetical protein